MSERFLPVVLSLVYLVVSYFVVGFKTDQLFLMGLVLAFYYLFSRGLLVTLLPFIIFWVVFDYMKAFPNYEFNSVAIKQLYDWEKSWFSISSVTPNEFFSQHQHSIFDFLSGFFYLTWVPLPIGFAVWLYFKRRGEALHFSTNFLWVNLLGFAVYYIYPAAPPWYVAQYGFDFVANTPGNTAGLARFDALLGIKLFTSMYEKSSNVFAAMPSLHSAYPLLVLFYGLKLKLGKVNLLFLLCCMGIWFGAVYSFHHYFLDVLGGVLCSILGYITYQRFIKRIVLVSKQKSSVSTRL